MESYQRMSISWPVRVKTMTIIWFQTLYQALHDSKAKYNGQKHSIRDISQNWGPLGAVLIIWTNQPELWEGIQSLDILGVQSSEISGQKHGRYRTASKCIIQGPGNTYFQMSELAGWVQRKTKPPAVVTTCRGGNGCGRLVINQTQTKICSLFFWFVLYCLLAWMLYINNYPAICVVCGAMNADIENDNKNNNNNSTFKSLTTYKRWCTIRQ